MKEKTTGELEQELKRTSPANFDEYLKNNQSAMVDHGRCFMDYMNRIIKEKGLLKRDIFLRADIPQGYGYKLLSEEKVTKQRDIILRICYAANCTLQETQHALQLYQMSPLYARESRDALIMACFNNRPGNVTDVNELLLKNKMNPLRSSGMQE